MTGIERLRELSKGMHNHGVTVWQLTDDAYEERFGVTKHGPTIKNFLSDIADQIEREHAEDRFRMGERAVEGKVGPKTLHEMAISLLDDWEREAIERERDRRLGIAADVSVSAYDLLPEEEREAIAWVREHGGIEHVRQQWGYLIGRADHADRADRQLAKRQRQIDESHAALRRRKELLGQYREANETLLERGAEMRRRLMPEGMEWLVEAWPRFKDDAPVRFLDDFERYGEESGVSAVTIYADGSFALNFRAYSKGERVNRPAPKALDADGVEIRRGDTVWDVEFGCEHVVTKVSDGAVFVAFEDESADRCDPASLTHRAPVLAADGRPLREGEHVYNVETGAELVVKELPKPGEYQAVVVFAPTAGHLTSFDPDRLTHERPDSWERLEEDAWDDDCEYFGRDMNDCKGCPASRQDIDDFYCDENEKARDLVRRAKKLAGVGE